MDAGAPHGGTDRRRLNRAALAHGLGLKVMAEGVETVAQRDFLVVQRCDYLQGYFYGRPEPAARIVAPLRPHAESDVPGL